MPLPFGKKKRPGPPTLDFGAISAVPKAREDGFYPADDEPQDESSNVAALNQGLSELELNSSSRNLGELLAADADAAPQHSAGPVSRGSLELPGDMRPRASVGDGGAAAPGSGDQDSSLVPSGSASGSSVGGLSRDTSRTFMGGASVRANGWMAAGTPEGSFSSHGPSSHRVRATGASSALADSASSSCSSLAPLGASVGAAGPAVVADTASTTSATGSSRHHHHHHSSGHSRKESHGGSRDRVEFKITDFENILDLGSGNGGLVRKVRYLPTGKVMAKKEIVLATNSDESISSLRRRILHELKILYECQSPHIVSFYGAFLEGVQVQVCMEFMDLGSLDTIYQAYGPMEEEVVAQVALSMLGGITYLYDKFKIMHRDIKPQNTLANSRGEIKIADFGVSKTLENSRAATFVGTLVYMPPERIAGERYSVRSDVWSLGLTLIEIANARFPYNVPKSCPAIELMQIIINDAAPAVVPGRVSDTCGQFIAETLIKDPSRRPSPKELLKHPFVTAARASSFDMAGWAQRVRAALSPSVSV